MKRADQRKYHYIYRITRTDGSGKYYIGMHSTDDLDDGYFGSGSLLSRSIKKHGKEKHTKEILEHLPTREALKLREKVLVNEELLDDKKCMNLKLGGEGGFDHLNTPKMLWQKNEASRKGNQALQLKFQNPEFREAWGKRASEGLHIQYASGRKPTGWSKEASERSNSPEANAKRRISMIGKQDGERNSQFGTCWVTNGIPLKIKKQNLEAYLNNGYVQGRKWSQGVHGRIRPCHG